MSANASVVTKENTCGLALYQTYRNRNPYDHDADGFSEIGKLNANTFGLRGYYRPNPNSRLGIEYHTINEFRRGGNKFDQEPFNTDITEQTKHVINSGGVNYDLFLKESRHRLSFFASAQHVDRNSYYGTQQDPNAYGRTKDLTWVAGTTYSADFDRVVFSPAQFTAGAEYHQDNLHDLMSGYGRDLKQDVRIGSLFVQNEWKMKRFNLLASVRMDKHNLIDNPIFSPRLNLLYKPTEHVQARATWSTGFRAPQAYDEDLHVTAVGGEGVIIRLAPGLDPEKSNSFSGSVEWFQQWHHFNLNLLAEGFFTMLNDVFYLQEIGTEAAGNTVQVRMNGSGADVYGVNLDAKVAGRIVRDNDASLQAGFTVQRSRYRKTTTWSEDNTIPGTRNMPRTPNCYGYFTFSFSPLKPLQASLSGVYTGRMYVPHFAPVSPVPENYPYTYIKKDEMKHTPDFFELNAKLSYTLLSKAYMKLEVNAGVQNICNAFQKDLDKGTFRDSGYFYGPTQPRTFFVGIKLYN